MGSGGMRLDGMEYSVMHLCGVGLGRPRDWMGLGSRGIRRDTTRLPVFCVGWTLMGLLRVAWEWTGLD